MQLSAGRLALAAAVAASMLLGCGKKGPPLPPLVGSKPRVKDLQVRQVGTTVRARFSLPVRAGEQIVDYKTKAIELWRRPASAEEPETRPGTPPRRPLLGPAGMEDESPGLPVKEFTSTAALAQVIAGDGLFDLLASPEPELVDQLPPETYGTELEYAVVLKTDLKSSGTVSDLVRFTPQEPPAAPADVVIEPVETGLRVTWTPATADGTPIPVNIYRAEPDRAHGSAPLNPAPIERPPHEDAAVAPDTVYRYVLRSIAPSADPPVESDATPETAATWKDVFPPAVPTGLRAFVDAGRVTLLWTPNDERDLLGYHAWRRIPGGPWNRLTVAPLPSATYTDASPGAGQELEYSITSVDRAQPPNESQRSAAITASPGIR